MPSKIKIRSVSVEDLGNIVKKMIDGVLEDNDQAAKLRQAVFEEYYSKKMVELKEVKAKIDADRKLNQTSENPKIVTPELEIYLQRSNFGIGDTKQGDIDQSFCILSDSEISATPFNGSTPEDGPPFSKSSKSFGVALNSEETDEEAANSLVTVKPDTSVVHVVRRPKYIRFAENIHSSDIILGLVNHQTTTNLTQNPNYSDTPLAKSENKVEPDENSSGDVEEVIEWWRSPSKNKVARQDNIQPGKTREIPVQCKSKGEIAFENWKKVKTDTYHRVFREEQERKRLDRAAKARQNEKKEAANAAYLYWKRQKSSSTRRRILPKIQESQRVESSEKRRANSFYQLDEEDEV